MQREDLEQSIKELREAAIPSSPVGIEAAVLRRVREEQRATEIPVAEWLHSWILRPGFATAALSFTVFMTIATSALAVRLHQPNEASIARTALGFESLSLSSALDLDRP